MNVLFLTLLYPEETKSEVMAASRDGLQNQIDGYQRALIRGIRQGLREGESLNMVNSLPVGVFPLRYRKPLLKGGEREGGIRELPGLNLPWFKQKGREWGAAREIRAWARKDPQNRTILVYTLYEPYMKALEKLRREFPDLRAAAIVTDLPNQWGLASYRRGVMKRLEYHIGARKLKRTGVFDGFVLLTESMKEVLNVGEKPCMVIEGLISDELPAPVAVAPKARPAVLYSGTLIEGLGIDTLLRAFEQTPEYELWLCGRCDMDEEIIRKSAKKHENIRYLGFLPQQEVWALQQKADALINPRSPEGAYTRYSFPSKTLEYLRAGKPTLCYPLEGIPREYDDYLYYIEEKGADGVKNAVQKLMELPAAQREERALRGREYVLQNKNPRVQSQRLLDFLRSLR